MAGSAGLSARAALAAEVDAEWRQPLPAGVVAFARELAARGGSGVAAVLFYGSALRDAELDGVLDFYLLLDRWRDAPGSRVAAAAGALLPPNVGWLELEVEGRRLRAKTAVMTSAQFRAAMSPRSLDTTLWARFSQPCACAHARSDSDRVAVREAVCDAIETASHWAALLGPGRGDALAFWRALFVQTYALELRVERGTRSADIVARNAGRYARLLPLAWAASGLAFDARDGELAPTIDRRARREGRRRWAWRRRFGRPLNLARLLKTAMTFDNAIDYVAWKIERHSGYRLVPTPFQRRHPLLSAPGLYWRLKRRGVLR